MENKIDYQKEKLSTMQKISNEVFNDLKIEMYKDSYDYLYNTMTVQLSAFIYSKMVDERELHYYFERPKFLEWLFRKKRKATFNLKVKDLLLNKSETKDTIWIYEII